mmetsp:Transcript_13542/g.34561  ORF Transcript_13542/g.34561 Transcript_13542/m.34561 type:complete len:257 (+) Transcript_13542:424-1194(+)
MTMFALSGGAYGTSVIVRTPSAIAAAAMRGAGSVQMPRTPARVHVSGSISWLHQMSTRLVVSYAKKRSFTDSLRRLRRRNSPNTVVARTPGRRVVVLAVNTLAWLLASCWLPRSLRSPTRAVLFAEAGDVGASASFTRRLRPMGRPVVPRSSSELRACSWFAFTPAWRSSWNDSLRRSSAGPLNSFGISESTLRIRSVRPLSRRWGSPAIVKKKNENVFRFVGKKKKGNELSCWLSSSEKTQKGGAKNKERKVKKN